jgi:tetratricopeptide (TPR) repeat protein
MVNKLAQKAIDSALKGNWKKAKEINKLIVKNDPEDTEALNRLAKAYAELGEINKAKSTAKNVLKIDPFDNIAKKSLKKWIGIVKKDTSNNKKPSKELFLEEPGKTKIVSLMHPGDISVIAQLDSCDELVINTHGHRITLTTHDGKYIGKLADDLSSRLKKLIRYGNEYQVFIKNIEDSNITIFIKEIKRSKKLADIPSFSSEKIEYISFTPPELVHKKDSISSS